MQIRCSTCTKTIAIQSTGVLPPQCPHCSRSPLPERLGVYVLDRLIATGGMGEVYLAHHEELGTAVAIKLLPALPLDVIDSVRERFAREARLTAKVAHRGVVRVLSSDASGDRPYLVLELVSGATLRHMLQEGTIPPGEAARIVAETADVLAAAHQQGVLHRDIKPDNVMLEPDGSVRVLDFGIARAIADDTPLTRTGEIVGTPEYMAPEQLLDGPEATDERTDVHALGVLLYELLTGRSPFRGANLFQSLKLVESLVPKEPSDEATTPAGFPHQQLNAVVLRALEKQASDRYASAAEFAAAIRTAVPAARQARQPATRSKAATYLAAGGVLFGIASLVIAALLMRTAFDAGVATKTVITHGIEQLQGITADQVTTTNEQLQALHAGHWCLALASSERSLAAGDDLARPIAQMAFALSHAVWLQAAELPTWLAAYDIGRRQRLFGDLLEPGDGSTDAMRALLRGEPDAWQDLATAGPLGSAQLADAVMPLLEVTAHPVAERAELLHAIAQRLPIEAPEHWLARTIERHLRNDRVGASQAAERAWLSGAGELAILLDAALAIPYASSEQRLVLWQRLAKSDRDDCPASTLLLLDLETIGHHRVEFEPHVAITFPLPHRAAAGDWFVQQARTADANRQMKLLRIAVALAQVPDLASGPWSSLSAEQQSQLETEAKRAR